MTRIGERLAAAPALVLALALALPRGALEAQIIRPPSGGSPIAFTSLSVGLFQAQNVLDGRTDTAWRLDQSSGLAFRGTLEYATRGGASFGVVGGFVRMPLEYYSGLEGPGGPVPECQPCDAHVDIMSLGGLFHIGGGQGLHQVIEVSAGVTHYRNFSNDESGGSDLVPESDTDLSFAVGYGFGYALNSRLAFTLVQDYGMVLHQGENLPNNASRTASQRVTRLGVRMALGARRGGF